MNSEDNKTAKIEKEYSELMKNFEAPTAPFTSNAPQWNGPNDFIVKFSLYQESPNSITSTDTLATI